ncbi:hypothetical protein D3C80_178960 [compost metagenome]
MPTKKLSKAEREWLERMKELALQAPARFSSYTTGDCCITIFDNTLEADINALVDSGEARDFSPAVSMCNAELGVINFPTHFLVHSTAG